MYQSRKQENNYNLIRPKSYRKISCFYEMSPHGILISGAEVSKANLFVNNSSGVYFTDIGCLFSCYYLHV
ncbi:BREX system Lon protease-like protein BrxL [Winogradskyella sp.]|nr:BREX system Lon protease-like protein BrxL [Winogradskyella sp.]